MLLKNPTSIRIVCEALGFAVAPGDTVEVEDGYCTPRASVPGTVAQEPAIRLLCPQLVPADDKQLSRWLANEVIVTAPPPPPPTAAQLAAGGLPPAVAELAAAGNAASAPRAGQRPGPNQGRRP